MKHSRLIACLIVLAMLLSWIVVPESHVHAAGENSDKPTITVGSVEGKPGDTLHIPVTISNNPGITILNMRVQFENAAVTVVNSRNNPQGPLGGVTFMKSQQNGTNPVTMYWESGLEDYSDNGIIGYVEVVINDDAQPGEYSVYIKDSPLEAYNIAFDMLTFDLIPGTITVLGEGCTEHSFINYVSNGDATCTKDGTETAKCDNCDETHTRTDTGSKLGHSFTNYVSNGNATCESDGTKTAKCDRCEVTDTKADVGSKLGHSFTNYVSNGDASCEADGTETAKCNNCDETHTRADAGSKLGHSFTNYASNGDATCESDGTKTAKCDRCEVTDTKADAGSKLGHSFTNYVSNGNATCKVDGTETAKCDRCDEKDTRTDVGSKEAADHSFPKYTSDGNATCTADGTKSRVCSVCGKKETVTDVGSALGHTEGAAVVENEVPASCGENGSYDSVVYCVTCDAELSRDNHVIPATGDHNYATETKRVNPTCTVDGYVIKACGCGATKKTDLPATGHTPGDTVIENKKEATCSVDGGYDEVTYCTTCDAELSRNHVVVSAKGHTAGDTVIENKKEATCTVDGGYDEVTYCTTCDVELTRNHVVVSAKGHTAGDTVIENKKEATCTVDGGYDEVTYCTTCDAELTRNHVVVSAKGHTAGEIVIENKVEASCATDGSYDEVVYCVVCDAELSRDTIVVAATGEHNYATEIQRVEPTCTKDGYVIKACGCDATKKTVLPATGHTAGETVIENKVEATCTADGSYDEAVYCVTCNAELSRNTVIVSAKGHTAGETVIENKVEATCTTDGSYDEAVYCVTCDAELSRNTVIVSAKGHTAGETVIENKVEASCATDGSYDEVVYCAVCDAELSRGTVTVPATGKHNYATEIERVEATCTEDGYVIKACGCGATEKTVLPATGHTASEMIIENKVEATCTTAGGYDEVTYCVTCDVELSRESVVVPATGDHNYATETERVNPTCTADGYVIKTCGCGATEKTVLPATGHTAGEMIIENKVEATCTTDGSYDEITYCVTCGNELNRKKVTLAALGHSFTNYLSNNDATCEADGTETAKCDRCDAVDTRTATGSALGHDWTEWTVTVAPTCIEAGEEHRVCGNCDREETKTVDALGHNWDEGKVILAPTCEEEGKTAFVCGVCGETENRVAAALGHEWKGATCTDPKTCSVCSKTEGEAVGHDLKTKANDAMHWEFCAVCSMEFKEAAKAHTDTDGDSKCDDCGVKMAVADPSTPPTADGFYILLWIMMMAACLFAMAVVIRRWKKLTA